MDPYREPAERAEAEGAAKISRSTAQKSVRWGLALLTGVSLCIAMGAPLVSRWRRPVRYPVPIPPQLLSAASAFPAPRRLLPPSVPLEPLLASDAPDRLAMIAPAELAFNLRPGEPVTVRFNRPMVEGARVGKNVPDGVLDFTPPVRGKGSWTSRSTFSFEAATATWSTTRTVTMTLSPSLRSLAGESVADPEPRSIVFDAGPMLIGSGGRNRGSRSRRLAPGDPLELLFSGKIEASALSSQMLVYEIGGGQRSLPYSVAPRAADEHGNTPVDVKIRHSLNPGAHIAVALAPQLVHGGREPRVLDVELAPRPRIEGIDCPEDAVDAESCNFRGPPERIVDIGEALVLLSSAELADLPAGAIEVRPTLPSLDVRLKDKRRIVVRGNWAPGQVYELRVGKINDAEGRALQRFSPLAVRSAGRPPEVRSDIGRLTYERDAKTEIRFAGIHLEQAEARVGAVPPGSEFDAILNPARWIDPEKSKRWVGVPLLALAPSSRPNRWAQGVLDWSSTDPWLSSMAVVSMVADRTLPEVDSRPSSFVQRTDLGINARLLPTGALIWVTSVSSAKPVAGAVVTLASLREHESKLAEANTDEHGMAWIPLVWEPLEEGVAVRAVLDDDRAVLMVDPRSSMGGRHLGVTPGEKASVESWRATLFTDRGICRPGENVHVKATLRSLKDGTLAALTEGTVELRLFGPSGEAPIDEKIGAVSKFGTVEGTFEIAPDATPGTYRIEARLPAQTKPAGTVTVTVGEYRTPTLRVDATTSIEQADNHDGLRVSVAANHLFGPPAAGLTARWSLIRESEGEYPARWSAYKFTPAGAAFRTGTVASGDLTLDASGHATIDTTIELSAPVREDALIEVNVRDISGVTTAARRTVRTYPATYEVGLHSTPDWISPGAQLDIDAIVIAHDGALVAGRKVEARILREGWHSYWEWSGHAKRNGSPGDVDDESDDHAGAYRARKNKQNELVHKCALTSSDAPVHCAWTPDRAGTYVLEVTTTDDRGRRSTSSERVYVAGHDEFPDRDPPGAKIEITPAKSHYAQGDVVEVAFESPFAEAEALLVVEGGSVLHREHQHVRAGGNVMRFTATPEMVPNAFVSLTLVRPRTGPPGATVDLDAPDLRVGIADINVRPASSTLGVAIEIPATSAPAGSDVSIGVKVTDETGKGAPSEVALYAVDEGTLRVTAYTTPEPLQGMIPKLAPSFVWEDLRRTLVSRIEHSLIPSAGGDGDSSGARVRVRDAQERFDPTPLWLAQLVTDAEGRATAKLHLPERPAQYRIMAVAVDAAARAGRSEGVITSSMPIVVRSVLPAFVTMGDSFEAAVFIHNTESTPVDVVVTPTVDGAAREATHVHLAAKGEERVSAWIEATKNEPVRVRFDAQTEHGNARTEARVEVAQRGRIERDEMIGGVDRSREIALALPEGTDGPVSFTLSLATHPFVGFGAPYEMLLASTDAGVETTASRIIALAADVRLGVKKRPNGLNEVEVKARTKSAITRLSSLQTHTGGFGRFSVHDTPDDYLSAYALHALLAARNVGFAVSEHVVDRARVYLAERVRTTEFLDRGSSGHDDLAFALRVLAESGERDEGRIKAVFDQRERLSPYGLSQLALSMDASDSRSDTLVLEAVQRVLATRADERANPGLLRWYDSSSRTLGAVLEAALSTKVAIPRAGEIAARILTTRSESRGVWCSTHETSHALAALAAYASSVSSEESLAAVVSMDGQKLTKSSASSTFTQYTVSPPKGAHTLRIEVPGTAFFSLSARWSVPLGAEDAIARGEVATLHRVLEDAAGKPLGSHGHVHLGDLIRVRLFLFTEQPTPSFTVIHDRLGGGLEPLDAGHDTSPQAALSALLGQGPDDDVVDARGHYAQRSLEALSHRVFLPTEAAFYLEESSHGLREFTYGVRASAVGTFELPPAELDAFYTADFVARSTTATVVVDP